MSGEEATETSLKSPQADTNFCDLSLQRFSKPLQNWFLIRHLSCAELLMSWEGQPWVRSRLEEFIPTRGGQRWGHKAGMGKRICLKSDTKVGVKHNSLLPLLPISKTTELIGVTSCQILLALLSWIPSLTSWLCDCLCLHTFNSAAVTLLLMFCKLLFFLLIAAYSGYTLSSANTVSTRDRNSFPTQRFILFSLPPDFFPSAFLTFNSHYESFVESTFIFCSALKGNSGMRMCSKEIHLSLC